MGVMATVLERVMGAVNAPGPPICQDPERGGAVQAAGLVDLSKAGAYYRTNLLLLKFQI